MRPQRVRQDWATKDTYTHTPTPSRSGWWQSWYSTSSRRHALGPKANNQQVLLTSSQHTKTYLREPDGLGRRWESIWQVKGRGLHLSLILCPRKDAPGLEEGEEGRKIPKGPRAAILPSWSHSLDSRTPSGRAGESLIKTTGNSRGGHSHGREKASGRSDGASAASSLTDAQGADQRSAPWWLSTAQGEGKRKQVSGGFPPG